MTIDFTRLRTTGLGGIIFTTFVAFAAHGCGSDTAKDPAAPPEGAAAVEAWLTTGVYKQWQCEPSVHVSRDPSPHGFNRICSNSIIAANATGTSAWPKGAAAVKELFADVTAVTPVGYAVYLKTAADSAGGAAWYWYERVPLNSPATHDAAGVVADGRGAGGCVSCHAGAGSDAAHTPTPGGRDQVYTAVR